jgi:CRP/FNR family cyclic AMP-dependent transcriptional regulator
MTTQRGREGPPGAGRLALLQADPDLGCRLSAHQVAQARDLAVPVVNIETGEWSPPEGALDGQLWGAIVLEGALLRDLVLDSTSCSELLGPGDVFSPSEPHVDQRLVPCRVSWSATQPTRLGVLEWPFFERAAAWPGLLAELFERAAVRSFRLGIQMGICQLPRVETRLLLMLWHLAERWGHVGVDEVVLPLALSHRLLGQLVGARRPTITLALSRLEAEGLVHRQPDGKWVLSGHGPAEPFLPARRPAPAAPASR